MRGCRSRGDFDPIKNTSGVQAYNDKWAKTTLLRLLRNLVYVGRLYYNKTRLKGKKVEFRDRSDWVEIPTTPLVEEWIFQEAQKRFKENLELKKRS